MYKYHGPGRCTWDGGEGQQAKEDERQTQEGDETNQGFDRNTETATTRNSLQQMLRKDNLPSSGVREVADEGDTTSIDRADMV